MQLIAHVCICIWQLQDFSADILQSIAALENMLLYKLGLQTMHGQDVISLPPHPTAAAKPSCIWVCSYFCVRLHLSAAAKLRCMWVYVCRTLEVLQDQVEPGPVEDVDEVLQRELGAPASLLFAEFEPEARAAASLAQVVLVCSCA